MDSPQLETDCETFNRTSRHWKKKPNLKEFVKRRHLSMKLLSEDTTKVLHRDDDFGDGTPACRECTDPRADSDSRLFAAFRERTIMGSVLHIHIIKFLGNYGIEIQIPSTTSPTRTSWVVISLRFDETKIAKCVPEAWKLRILGPRLD